MYCTGDIYILLLNEILTYYININLFISYTLPSMHVGGWGSQVPVTLHVLEAESDKV